MDLIFLILFPIFLSITLYYSKKNNFVINDTGQFHQKFVEKEKIPIVGGIYILIGFLFYNFDTNFFLIIHFILIFFLGISSDTNILNSPKLRIIFQITIIASCVLFNELNIYDTRIIFLDQLLLNKYVNFLFVIFCILIMVNGSNFIDGVNTLLIGYYLIIILNIINSDFFNGLNYFGFDLFYWFFILIILFFFNLFKKTFMGDSGAYTLGLIFSCLLINLNQQTSEISPFFIVLLAWYPSYELLFSMVRKFKFGLSPIKPDNKHFHQLVYFYISKKFKIKSNYVNSTTGILINLYNFLIIFLAFQNYSNSQFQIMLIFFSTFLYTYLYLKLFLYRFRL